MPGYEGTAGDDIYEGDEVLADYINLLGGDDVAQTYGGNDNVVAGDGDNDIDTGNGNDTIMAGDGNDTLSGGDGNDFIFDEGGRIYLDQLIFGGSGNDQIVIRNGGLTYAYGGLGDDTYQLIRAGDITEAWLGVPNVHISEYDVALGGHDKIILSTGWSGFVMALGVEDLIADNSNAEKDRITWDNRIDNTVLGVEVTGNASHNKITGSFVRDILRGETGNDTLSAEYGEGDKLYGGADHDRLVLNFATKAKLYGGAGDDTYVLRQWTTDAANSIVEYSNQGEDTIEVYGATIDLNRANLYAIENVTFSGDFAGVARTVTGNALNNIILTHAANDTAYGLGGDDEIRTGLGADWLEGGVGHDTLDGGGGGDRLYGGTGNDSLLAGSGDDWAYGDDGDDQIHAGEGTDFVWAGIGSDAVYGNAGTDFLRGDAGTDTLSGDNGNDWLYGGDSNDRLYGGADSDRLYGDAGADVLYGGTGADWFVFANLSESTVAGYDRVMDFVRGSDLIDLSGIDANVLVAGNQTFHFTGPKPFFASAGDLSVTSVLSGTLVEGDVNGDGLSDFRVLVAGQYGTMTGADFIL